MVIRSELARGQKVTAQDYLASVFPDIKLNGGISAQYAGFAGKPTVIGVTGLDHDSPFVSVLLDNEALAGLWDEYLPGHNILITTDGGIRIFTDKDGKSSEITGADSYKAVISDEIAKAIVRKVFLLQLLGHLVLQLCKCNHILLQVQHINLPTLFLGMDKLELPPQPQKLL